MARRRAFFGLLDANGWGWAIVKAAFWFVVIVMLMAYLPDRALYATVQPTIDIGVSLRTISPALDVTPVNLCPDSNTSGYPCPAPAGAVLPWQPGPPELYLPAPRTGGTLVAAGLQTLYVGGTDGSKPQSTVYATVARADGNLDSWSAGVSLPAPRADAAAVFFSGVAYVIGGVGEDGKPTDTVFAGTPDPATGKVAAWKESADLKLPAPRAGAAIVVAGDGLILIGGTDGTGPTATVWKATVDTKSGQLQKWATQAPLTQFFQNGPQPAPRVHASATLAGSHVFVWGGEDPSGPTTAVLQGIVSADKATLNQIVQWGTSNAAEQNLPAAYKGAFGWVANGTLYYAGGEGAKGHVVWAIPDATGTIPGWKSLGASDLSTAEDLRGAAPFVSGSHVFVVGGTTVSGVTQALARADMAPKPPFFQVGLFYVVVPAMGIGGEVGQQLSYLSAAGVATLDFVILLLIGYAFNHREQTRAFFERLRTRRRRAG